MQAWQPLLPQVWFQNNLEFESIGILLHYLPSCFVLSSSLNHALIILARRLVRETPEYSSKSSSEASREGSSKLLSMERGDEDQEDGCSR